MILYIMLALSGVFVLEGLINGASLGGFAFAMTCFVIGVMCDYMEWVRRINTHGK